jgi:anti-sigma regulatory factor (Ser/Thr protein kinase)
MEQEEAMGVRAMLPPPAMLTEPMSWRGCAQSFPGRPDQVRAVRVFLARFLAGAPGADDAVLLISELATNACTHSASGSPGGRLTVRTEFCPGLCIHVEVEDQGSAWDGLIVGAVPPHGLYLLRELSATCGARRGEQGWVTWFTITSPAATRNAPRP